MNKKTPRYLKKFLKIFLEYFIRPYRRNSIPSKEFIETFEYLQKQKSNLKVAEFGVDKGASSIEILKRMNDGDILDLYDMEKAPLFRNKKELVQNTKATINFHINSNKGLDSYSWSLAKTFLERNQSGNDIGIWDLIYLDGAHNYLVDGMATVYLKELLKVNGIIIFDDMQWSFSVSSNKKNNKKNFTDEQIKTPHVSLVVDTLIRSDKRFEELSDSNSKVAIFKKLNI